jgi:hypothetical protein
MKSRTSCIEKQKQKASNNFSDQKINHRFGKKRKEKPLFFTNIRIKVALQIIVIITLLILYCIL